MTRVNAHCGACIRLCAHAHALSAQSKRPAVTALSRQQTRFVHTSDCAAARSFACLTAPSALLSAVCCSAAATAAAADDQGRRHRVRHAAGPGDGPGLCRQAGPGPGRGVDGTADGCPGGRVCCSVQGDAVRQVDAGRVCCGRVLVLMLLMLVGLAAVQFSKLAVSWQCCYVACSACCCQCSCVTAPA